MSYPVAYLSFTVTSMLVALLLPSPWRWLALWWGLGMGWAALAYGPIGASALGKGVDGRLPWWSWLVAGPFLLAHRLMLTSLHRTSQETPATEVVPGVFLGRRPSPRASWLGELPIVAVVDCTAELPRPSALGSQHYLAIPVLDAKAPTDAQFDEAVAFVDRYRHSGVLVHCALGHGRSASVVAAWLLRHGGARSVAEAELMLRDARPRVALSRWQRGRLARWHAHAA